MDHSRTVRCPLCGHESPRPASRTFVLCTCGLRVTCEPLPSRVSRSQVVFAVLALASLMSAAADLFRRFW